jgi:hypothetical protein
MHYRISDREISLELIRGHSMAIIRMTLHHIPLAGVSAIQNTGPKTRSLDNQPSVVVYLANHWIFKIPYVNVIEEKIDWFCI